MSHSQNKFSKLSQSQITYSETEDEPIPSSLGNSRDLGLISDVAGEETTEDDGFIPVKSKGRKRIVSFDNLMKSSQTNH